ncbi:MAG: hypothetical protein CVV47_05860 [Spirochaetae bacterium HGW-Spirochaetae-3]|nr:MAG: hypothetical protein CVV47_05860 [Spirochaetae bacterium HGW-Spirochaetae-3]
MQRPLDPVTAADFELGDLVSGGEAPELLEALGSIAAGLAEGRLPYDRFSAAAAEIARVRYGEKAFEGSYAARVSAPTLERDGTASARLRVFATRSGVGSSALGLAILSRGETGEWIVEHFELDTDALNNPETRPGTWDPYATPLSY